MKEQLVSFEVAKLAKEKGFDTILHTYYTTKGVLYDKVEASASLNHRGSPYGQYGNDDIHVHIFDTDNSTELYLAPTQSLLQKWLREEYNLSVEVQSSTSGWIWEVYKINGIAILWSSDQGPNDEGAWDVFEEALEDVLQKALELI